MKAYNFFKVDCLRCKTQLMIVTGMMLFFAVFFTFNQNDITFACGYLCFLAVMFSVQPFTMDQKSESGFIDMLPGRTNDRVYGRFLYTTMIIGLSIIISLATIAAYVSMGKTFDHAQWAIYLALIGLALIICSIEVLILYSIGKGKSQQFMVLAQMIPGMGIFFIATYVGEYLADHPEIDMSWIVNNQNIAAGAVLAFGLVFYVITIQISKIVIRKRDFE